MAWTMNAKLTNVCNKKMYTGKNCQKLKRVYMFIRYTRVAGRILTSRFLYVWPLLTRGN